MAVDSNLNVTVTGDDQLSPALAKLESQVIRVVGAVSAALAGIKVAAFPILSAAEFENELVQVQKTTNFTAAEIDDLGKKLLNLSKNVNVSANDLAKIAAVAGQHGLGKEGVDGVAQFTDSVARMSSVLNVSVEQASQDIVQIINIFKLPISQLEQAVSAFNQVSNNSTAQGKQLLDVVRRIGDAAGSLNLQQSIGLGAAGLDLGVNPEVVGSAFTQIFAKMRSKADDFASHMKITTKSWINLVSTDGVAALKQYLDYLRTLTDDAQAKAITKLTGGGRQGALVQKLVEDSSNAILDKELRNATGGFDSGTSALREQLTVLNSLKSQADILKNNIFAIAEQAGHTITGALTQDVAQLSQALQTPETQRFVNAIVGAFGDVIEKIVEVTKFVGSLNINWENFIEVAKIFIGLKLATVFIDLSSRLPGVSLAMKLISNSSADAALGTKALTAATREAAVAEEASQASFGKRLVNLSKGGQALGDYVAKFSQYRNALKEQQAAEAELAAAKEELTQKQLAQNALAGQGAAGQGASGAIASQIVNQRAELQAAQQVADQQRIAQEADVNARLEVAEQAHQTRMSAIHADGFAQYEAANAAAATQVETANNRVVTLETTFASKVASVNALNAANRLDIEAKYQAEMSAVSGRGKAARLAELQAAMEEELATEDKRYARSLSGTNTYYQNQIDLANKSRDQIIANQEEQVADAITTTENLINNENLYYTRSLNGLRQFGESRIAEQVRQGEQQVAAQRATLAEMQTDLQRATTGNSIAKDATNAAAAQAAAAGKSVDDASKKFVDADTKLSAAKNTLGSVSAAFGVLTAAIGTLARVAVGAFFWVTILFSIADATGLLDKLGITMIKITDAFGITSKAARDAKASEDALNETYVQRGKLLDDLIKKNDKFKNPSTGSIDKGAVQADISQLTLGANADVRRQAFDALISKAEGAQAEIDKFGNTADENTQKQITAQQAVLKKAQDQIKSLRDQLAQPLSVSDFGDTITNTKELNSALQDQQKIAADATSQIDLYQSSLGKGAIVTQQATESLKILGEEGFAKVFTNVSATIFKEWIVPIGAAQKKVEDLQAAAEKIAGEVIAGKATPADQAAALAAVAAARLNVAGLQQEFRTFANGIINTPGLPPHVADSIRDLLVMMGFASNAIDTLNRGIDNLGQRSKLVQRQGGTLAGFTGDASGAISNNIPTSGEGGFNAKDTADKIAKAKFALEKANAEARINLAKEFSKELSDVDAYQYAHGLISLAEYFTEKTRIEQQANAFDIEQLQKEKTAAQAEADAAKDEAGRLKGEADVAKIEGRIKVLEAHGKTIDAANGRLYADAKKNFDDMVVSEAARALTSLVAPAGADAFNTFLQDNMDKARLTIARFEAETAKGKVDLTPAVDLIKLQALVSAVQQTLAPIKSTIATINGAFATLETRLNLLAEAGLATQAEVDKSLKEATIQQISQLNEQIDQWQKLLDKEAAAGAAGSELYRNMALEIENAKNEVIKLSVETDKWALKMNQDIASSFQSGLAGFLDGSISSLDGALKKFTDGVKKTIANAFAQDITNSIVKNLGIGGDGGIGGLLSKGRDFLFGGSNKAVDAAGKSVADALGKKADGSSESNALWVRLSKGLGLSTEGDGIGALGGGLKSISDRVSSSLGGLPGLFGPDSAPTPDINSLAKQFGVGDNTFGFSSGLGGDAGGTVGLNAPGGIGSIFSGFTDKMSSIFSDAGDKFSSIFSSLFSGGSSGSGLIGSFMGLFGTHHTGGIAGMATSFRLASPAIFANAMRFHNGGLPGLGTDEVAAILQKGEEVITANDPRNVLNSSRNNPQIRGGAGAGYQLTIHPDAINLTLRDWLEGEIARINANR